MVGWILLLFPPLIRMCSKRRNTLDLPTLVMPTNMILRPSSPKRSARCGNPWPVTALIKAVCIGGSPYCLRRSSTHRPTSSKGVCSGTRSTLLMATIIFFPRSKARSSLGSPASKSSKSRTRQTPDDQATPARMDSSDSSLERRPPSTCP
jgi:hypothetical protein